MRFSVTDLDCHAIKRVKKFALTGRLKDIDIKDSSHGAIYPNVSSKSLSYRCRKAYILNVIVFLPIRLNHQTKLMFWVLKRITWPSIG